MQAEVFSQTELIFKWWAIPDLFFFIFVFSIIQLVIKLVDKFCQ